MYYQNNNQNQGAVTAALPRWYNRAVYIQLVAGSWLQLHQGGTLFYNCGGITDGNDYGRDYVDNGLYNWLTGNLPANYVFAGGPSPLWGGNRGLNGNFQFVRDYYTITRLVSQQYQLPQAVGTIPAGTYRLVLNFHLYVGPWRPNPAYVAAPPLPAPAPPPPPVDINDLNQFPPLS
jgi:hypothetical protein